MASRVSRSTRRTASIARPATSRIRHRISIGPCPKAAAVPTIPTCELHATHILRAALGSAAPHPPRDRQRPPRRDPLTRQTPPPPRPPNAPPTPPHPTH